MEVIRGVSLGGDEFTLDHDDPEAGTIMWQPGHPDARLVLDVVSPFNWGYVGQYRLLGEPWKSFTELQIRCLWTPGDHLMHHAVVPMEIARALFLHRYPKSGEDEIYVFSISGFSSYPSSVLAEVRQQFPDRVFLISLDALLVECDAIEWPDMILRLLGLIQHMAFLEEELIWESKAAHAAGV